MAGADNTTEKKSVNKALSAARGREIGQPQLVKSSTFVQEEKVRDLQIPNLYHTVDQMMRDPAVKQPVNLNRRVRTNSLTLGEFEPPRNTSAAIALAEYANYMIHNMPKQTWFEAVNNMNTDVMYGFSLGELVTYTAKDGPYKGNLLLSHIGPRTPKSIYAWVWDEYEREVTHIIQKPMEKADFKLVNTRTQYLGTMIGLRSFYNLGNENKYPLIPIDKLLHVKYDPTFADPQGDTPLKAAYAPWREKRIIEEYQVIGITRDFGGIPIIRVPSELLERANDPDNRYPEDKEALLAIEQDAANTHAGRNAFFMMSSDLVEGSNSIYEYDIRLLGVDGSGKQFDISEIVKQKTTEIYNSFSMGHLILGQNGNTSSYNLSTTGQSVSATVLQGDLMNTALAIDSIIPRILDAHRRPDGSKVFEYDRRDLPKFRWKEINEISLDDLSKFTQRTKSVNGVTPEILEEAYKRSPLGDVDLSGLYSLDYTDKGESRAGESNGTSGTGNSQSGGANSSTNTENKSMEMPRQLIADHYGDGQIAYIDKTTQEIVGFGEENDR